MTGQSALAAALERKPPPLGGFSPAILRLEVRRLLRNRRTIILALVLPVLFFWGFGLNNSYVHETAGRGNVSAAEMISIACTAPWPPPRPVVRWSPSNEQQAGAGSCA